MPQSIMMQGCLDLMCNADYFAEHTPPIKEFRAGDHGTFMKWVETLSPDITVPLTEKASPLVSIPSLLDQGLRSSSRNRLAANTQQS